MDNINEKLRSIRDGPFKNELNEDNVLSSLRAMKTELEKLNRIVSRNAFAIDKLNTTQVNKFNDLGNDISKRLKEVEIIVKRLPNNKDTQKIIKSLNELKQSDPDILLQRSSGIATLISFFVMFAQLYLQYKPA